ncbi:MAG: death-on-curing family protein [Candidatus Nomurabacteria bacterium]|nr:death-on-curing family protein [Candidatus Nomurabacteria bacterium]
MTKGKKKYLPLTSENVFIAYKVLQDKNLVSFGIPFDANQKIESAISTVNADYFDYVLYPTSKLQAAACLFYVTKAHAFTDGNKRVAVLAVATFCKINDLELKLPKESLAALSLYIEQTKIIDSEPFIHALCKVMFTDTSTS